MKKLKIIGIILLSTLLLIPFGSFAKALPPTYVGVEEGTTYTWKISLKVAGLDELVDNFGILLDDIEASIAANDFWGYENLTIPETLSHIASGLANRTFPSGWEAMNISALIGTFVVDFVSKANSTMLSGNIPANWKALNFTTFMDYLVDGLNTTLPIGWEDNPIPELLKLVALGFNNSIGFGIIPTGWEDLTIKELFDQVLLQNTPKIRESFILHVLFNEVLVGEMPPGMSSSSIGDIFFDILPSNMTSLNISTFVLMMISDLNFSMPLGWESWDMETFINNQSGFVNPILPSGYDAHNMTTLMALFIDEMIFANLTMMLPPGILPPGLGIGNTTIRVLADTLIGELITQWDTMVVPSWNAQKSIIALLPSLGIRLRVDTIGTEVEAYPGGPRGVPIEMTGFFSLDMKNWTDIANMMGDTGLMTAQTSSPFDNMSSIISNFTYYYSSYIVDPSTYSNASRALFEQSLLTGGLIVANNYNWEDIVTNFSIPIGSDPNGIEGSSEWNVNGLLNSATLKANGVTAVTIELYEATDEIPGFEVGIVLTLLPLTIVGIVFYMKKKIRTK
ncbi:hypothetical protein LCGC14_1673110 [marine sediment metagenome]|uniref:Uncharacterized protein n=1 Tax=marine sediment metagenome TaxID=412755 RepID=A0A0F9HQR2_9ZZZZ